MKDAFMTVTTAKIQGIEKAYELRVSGKTYPHKDELRKMGFTYDGYLWEKVVVYTTKENMIADINKYIKTDYITVDKDTLAGTCKKLW